MKHDNILVKMPDRLDYFLAAAAVLQDYCVQLHKQAGMKRRFSNFSFTVQVPDESYMFFWPIFPTMHLASPEELIAPSRELWECVIDFTDIDRVWDLASTPKKHITEAWGIIFGSSPQQIPVLGPMQPLGEQSVDVLIDEDVPGVETLRSYMSNNYPQATVQVSNLKGLRPASVFNLLAKAKVFLGMRSGASYLAATMLKPMIELYRDDLPQTWMCKPQSQNFRMFYGSFFSTAMLWPILEELYTQAAGVEEELSFAGV